MERATAHFDPLPGDFNNKDFYTNKHIKQDIHSVAWVMHAPGVGLWGHWGAGDQKSNFPEHGLVAYQIERGW